MTKVNILILFCCTQYTRVSVSLKCEKGLYPPVNVNVPEYVINLDLPPEKRWTQVSLDHKEGIANLVYVLKHGNGYLMEQAFNMMAHSMASILTTLPQTYAMEIMGISKTTRIPIGDIVMYNLFYEISALCTSIVTQNNDGHIIHGRNLDFGVFLGWDFQNSTWMVTEALSSIIVKLNFQKDNRTVYRGVSFAGYVGLLTSMKPGRFSLSVNTRFSLPTQFSFDGGIFRVFQWIAGDHSLKWLGFEARDVTQYADNFNDALERLINSTLLAPAYLILGGTDRGQGTVITKNGRYTGGNLWSLTETEYKWFLVQGNYDHWLKPSMLFDKHGISAIQCLKNRTSINFDFAGMFDILSTKPVLSKGTTYTALMDPSQDRLEVFVRTCPNPCPLL